MAVGYAFARAQAKPPSSPAQFEREPAKKVVACLGASMIHGRISFDVVGSLRSRLGNGYQVVNAGVNGDLAWNALARVDSVIDCDPDYVIVLVGSNDVMAALDPKAEARYRRAKDLPNKPTLAWYRDSLRAIVVELRKRTRAEIALCSLPPLGEALSSPINQRLGAYNAAIRLIASETGAHYLPVHEDIARLLREIGSAQPRSVDGSPWPMFSAAIEHYVLGRSFDAVGRARGFDLFSDGVHLGSRAGGLLAQRFESFVRGRVTHADPVLNPAD